MATELEIIPKLRPGDRLTRKEFFRRWEAMPKLKKAELIRGIVYMPSPLSWDHGVPDSGVGTWLGVYAAATVGCETATNATWLMLKDSPQPDKSLRVLPEYGGQSTIKGKYASGAPEFIGETCLSSAEYDLHEKLDLYQQAGVLEYLTVLLEEQEIRWHRLVDGTYQLQPADADGLWRSVICPGLWLDGTALLQRNMARVLAVLHQGLASPEHAAFVAELQRRFAGGRKRKAAKSKKPNRKPRKNA